ncbi:hypothetical protein [Nitrolancea hollandica]|uniref:Uncharacterized protein n=1 Tax=Nitrolancea hollandica Lb TaxID=1129897 RepID=I4EL77_9BACT|nr:hypothetical protein [Nitrolancea hollandica]CCF85439.1 hypothetical protein NITHO_4990004 [Nitrolancea hollandica Lb]
MSDVFNAGPIIHRSWIGRLELLVPRFDCIVMPPAVRNEMLREGLHHYRFVASSCLSVEAGA